MTTSSLVQDFIYNNFTYFAILLSAIIGKLKESSKRNIFSAWLVYFFGTFFHELSHLIVSIFTNGKPTWFSVIPTKNIDKDGRVSYTLGYVKSSNMRWYNVALISFAPIMLIPLSFYFYNNFFNYFDRNILNYFIYIFVIVSLLFSSIPSGKDISNVFNGFFSFVNLIPLLAIGVFIYYYLNTGVLS